MRPILMAFSIIAFTGCGNENDFRKERIGTFITKPGKHQYSKHGGEVSVYKDGDKLNYRITHPKGDPGGPTDPSIPPESDWFIYIETWENAWIYQGNEKLILSSQTGKGIGFYQLSEGFDTLPVKPPKDVIDRLPDALKRLLTKS